MKGGEESVSSRRVRLPGIGVREKEREGQQGQPARRHLVLTVVLLSIGLCLCVAAVYWQVREFEFVNYDDTRYVVSNAMVHKGLSRESVLWAFQSGYMSNWHPVTWISHIADVGMFGLEAGKHHLMNVSLHLVNTLFLFVLLQVLTGSTGSSAFVAVLFAVHPTHVESVAWISERKDVLSTLFWLLTMTAYVWYVRRHTMARYLFVCLLFALGLMAKPMLVTLPLVLLLLDLWPLDRVKAQELPRGYIRLVAEKIPLLLMSLSSCVVTFQVQQAAGTVSSLEAVPLVSRLQNTSISYVQYLSDLLWPTSLTALYPLQSDRIQAWQAISCALLLVAITVGALRLVRRIPALTVGWLWYVGTLVPVIGIVQVGLQARADRYMYIPSIGFFILAAYGLPRLLPDWRWKRALLGSAAVLIVAFMTILAHQQTGYWRDSRTLFTHALAVTSENFLAHNNLGTALLREGRVDEAMLQFEEALRIRPKYRRALLNQGIGLGMRQQYADAQRAFESLLEIDPENERAHVNLGVALFAQGDLEGAVRHYRKALQLNPMNAKAQRNLRKALEDQSRWQEKR